MIRQMMFWLVWNVPLGRLAPHILELALGSKSERITEKKAEKWLPKY